MDSLFLNPEAFADARAEFKDKGFCHLKGFLSKKVCLALREEAIDLFNRGEAFLSKENHNVYQHEAGGNLQIHEVQNRLVQSRKSIIDFQRIPKESPLKKIYLDDKLLDFISKVVEKTVYHSGCAYNAGYYNVFQEGDGLGWHFDKAEFGVSVLLQKAESGGVFLFHHNTISTEDPWGFKIVERILDGKQESVTSSQSPERAIIAEDGETGPVIIADDLDVGSLVIFNGKSSVHRVTEVVGNKRELM
eukprot:CAMPEP_0204858828 /NCGR_PEP_ID=MMETSP1347-20130617/23267_1 /ASSEMBLY_ACC=CAM_ASM_000690 /TAXON_ID=215587 /ORGANISM="Aplanochytrium stocchinoi, Strain GSBS06" /LENGTH=246 /DNA_ID=CAMNT_0052007145 /DNA_START=267 /DNA_END=1008 /DNA_ORIENTATION=-